MAEKDTEGLDETSLELPSLFGRKKKRAPKDAPSSGSGGTPDDATTVIEPVREPAAETAATEPVREPVREPAAETADSVVTEPVREPAPQPAVPATPAPAARAAEPVRAPQPEPADEPTRTIPGVRKASRRAEPTAAGAPSRVAASTSDQPAPVGGARRAEPAARSLPSIGASLAALVVGALVGLLGVGLTWGSLRACDALTGTDSCGGPGLLVVLVVLVVMIMAGSALLRALGVTEPGGLSFLGVAIFVAICLVFLLEHLLDPWMVVVGPVLCALGYGTAHWVVNRFNTELLTEDQPEPHDVR